MYKVLLVDDEAPALRYLQAIVERYASDFAVAACCQSGESALEYLQAHKAALLVTDISMPGMNGIELSLKARALHPDIHVVIISGYADFEYAQGAIQAAVDDYILKPVTIAYMTAALDKLKVKLDVAAAEHEQELLTAMLEGRPYDGDLLTQLYGEGKYFFAFVRWGNLSSIMKEELRAAVRVPGQGAPFHALQGKVKEEQILYMKQEVSAGEFQQVVKAYVAQHKQTATWTIIFTHAPLPFSALADFVRRSERLLRQSVVIGRRQFLFLSNARRDREKPHIANATLKKLEYFYRSGNKKVVKDILITLASDWEKRQTPQLHVYHMAQQLVYTLLPAKPTLAVRQDEILNAINDLFAYAANYGELMAGVYSLLFDDGLSKDKKLSPEELYAYAIRYIREKFAEPINIIDVCSEIGISQTYLSRLFRKFGNTSFNVFLTQYRMENAMALMREHPDILPRDVAACVGYDDSSYFSKVFHQTTGRTPSQWASEQNGHAADANA